jgi:23S rRNA pseudouridine1911/1915/1917 synthase
MNTIERKESFFTAEKSPLRLDIFLKKNLPELSRSRIQALIKDGQVSIAGEVIRKPGFLTTDGQIVWICIPPSEPVDLIPEKIPLRIIFENDDLIVVDKPAGMVVHPAAGHSHGTLVHAVLAHAPDMAGVGGEQRPGVVHRLDRDTSGLILVAKNDQAHHWLQDQFRLRLVNKVYLALVDGHPPTPEGHVEAAIGRDQAHRKLMAVVSEKKGRQAETEYRTLETFPQHTLLEVHPLTGRTHQIRLHLKMIGCPIVGDRVYGRRIPTLPLDHQFLHAARLTITLPRAETPRTFVAPLPPDLEKVLAYLHKRM